MTARSAVRVLAADGLVSVQDLGRGGAGGLGVSPGGAADWYAARAANRLVGNSDGAPLIEATLGGFRLSADTPLRLAVTGADVDVWVAGERASTWCSVDAGDGAEIAVSPARRGVRAYLAIAGGIDVPPVLGSASTDVGAAFGGAVLKPGEAFATTGGHHLTTDPIAYPADAAWDLAAPALLRAMRGPDAPLVGEDALAALTHAAFRGSARSSRQALRLEGAKLDLPASAAELPSFGLCAGCVQVTADGSPIVLLSEHQTTGGYPVALCVITADIARAAQVRPGDPVRFAMVGLREAAEALGERFYRLASLRHATAVHDTTPASARLYGGFYEGA